MDAQLQGCGFYNLLQHAFSIGQMDIGAQFIGYPALQGLRQNAMIVNCISPVVDDMTKNWIEIKCISEQDDALDGGLAVALSEAQTDFKLKQVFHEAWFMGYFYGGCLIFIDTGADSATLELPLNLTEKSQELKSLRGFQVIDPINCFPGVYNSNNPLRPDYYQPQYWWALGTLVHHSRLIYIAPDPAPLLLKPSYNFFGIPKTQLLWDYVMHFNQCRASAQRLLTKFSQLVFKTNMVEKMERGGIAELAKRMRLIQKFRDNDSVIALDYESEDLVFAQTSLAGVFDVVKQSLELIPAVNGTPAVKTLGLSPSGFNATGQSDIRNYYDSVATKQEKDYDGIKTALNCVAVNRLGRIPKGLSFLFKPLWEEDKLLRAQIEDLESQTMERRAGMGVISTDEVRNIEVADSKTRIYGLDANKTPGREEAGIEEWGAGI
jgi:phage-related protein (TIGR01555 family)